MKTLVAAGSTQLFRGLRLGRPLTAGIGAALLLVGLARKNRRGGSEKLTSLRLKPGDEIVIKMER